MSRTVQHLFNLTGKTALVTGGSRGLGLNMAHALGEAGAKVIVTSRKKIDLQNAVATLHEHNIDASFIVSDCGNADDIKKLADHAVSEAGTIDILVNNAGAAWGAPAERHPLDAWDKVMNLNIRGYFLLSQHIANQSMIPNGGGKIINIASIQGLGGNPAGHNTIAYNSSKGAVINFTRALAAEWGKYNINVNSICPGFFLTKMTAGSVENMGGESKLISGTPLGRLGGDDDLKGLTVLFASDAGKHITGQWIAVDGGASVVIGSY